MRASGAVTLKALIATGKLKPVIDRRFPLGQVVDALPYVDERRARSKVVITMSPAEPA